MKHKILIISTLLLLFATACNKEELIEYSNTPPVIVVKSPEINGKIGETITLEAKVTDDFGIKFFTVFSGGLGLNKKLGVSSVDEIITDYDLSYSYKIPESVTGTEHQVILTVKNLTGQTSEANFRVVFK